MVRTRSEFRSIDEASIQPGFLSGILGMIIRRIPHIMLGVLIGSTIATIYFFQQVPVYESELTVLVGQRSTELPSASQSLGGGAPLIPNDILATHVELMTSRKIIEEAVTRSGLPVSIAQVTENLHVSKGGNGAFANAGVLKASYHAADPNIATKVLQAVFDSYFAYIEEKSPNVGSQAAELIANSLVQCEKELKEADARYREYMASCPATVVSDDGRVENVHATRLQKLESELEVLRQSLTRLQSRFTIIKDFARGKNPDDLSSLDVMAVLDQEEVARLMTLVNLNIESKKRAESNVDASAQESSRMVAAYEQKLLELNIKKEQLESTYGSNHPKFLSILKEISSAQTLIDRSKKNATPQEIAAPDPSTIIAPAKMLSAYANVLVNDIKGLELREKELLLLSEEESRLAKEVETACLSSGSFKAQLDRARARYDQVFAKLQEITLTNSVTGFSTDLIDPPSTNGEPLSPDKFKIAATGILSGGILGLCFAFLAEIAGSSRRSR
ncbi:MAG: Wzz/FepE/Etk N-terminal domain-containing protein [Planctomycetota bacterium]|nr:Wzz/FepE/Etk N-terminal domain-containing protein [Planctomycetota bacterium]